MQLIRYRVKTSRISHIFISHLHGDHFYGLIGLLNTFNLNGRTDDLMLYGPPGLADIITVHLRQSHTALRYQMHFYALDPTAPQCVYEDDTLTVSTMLMDHRIACWGFLFRERNKPRRINKERLSDEISVEDILALKQGQDLCHSDGTIRHQNKTLTLPPRRSRSYAYCADTRYQEALADTVQAVRLAISRSDLHAPSIAVGYRAIPQYDGAGGYLGATRSGRSAADRPLFQPLPRSYPTA